MDIQLPGSNEYELTKWIRNSALKSINEVKIIGLSAHASASDKKRALNTGMLSFLSKPFTKNELLDLIFAGKTSAAINPKKNRNSTTANLVNWKYLDELSDDKNFKRELINSFVQTAGSDMKKLRRACEAKEHETIKFLAHKIKGSVKMVEAKSLTIKLKALEFKSKEFSK